MNKTVSRSISPPECHSWNPLQIRGFYASFRRVWPGRAPDFTMSIRIVVPCFLLAMGSFSLTGCVSSSEVKASNEASVGQQLMDLDKAYHQGTITEKEYQKLRKAIISKND